MKIAVTIAGTDRTRLVDPSSLRVTNILTSKVDEAVFVIKKFGSRTYAPTVGEEVIIQTKPTSGFPYTFPFTFERPTTKIFAGRIVQVVERYEKLDYVAYEVSCVDYTRDLDRKLVVETYEGQTVSAIIADIASNYLDSAFTTNNVSGSTIIEYIAFNYEYPSKCLQQLAELLGYDWYVDYDKDIHFFAKESNAAPFNLSDTNGRYIYDSLKIRRDISPVRNTIYVRGGEYLADPFTGQEIADGNKNVFNLGYKFSDLQVTVTGQIKNIGIDNIDQETNYDALHNFQERIIRFRTDRKPRNGSLVQWSGRPYLPVLIKRRDTASIAAFSATEGSDGIYEFKIIDKSIKSKEGARQRARAEIISYAATLSEGEFKTYDNGLKAGHRIRIQSDLRGLDEYFVINRVETKTFDNRGNLIYTVNIVSARTFDHIDFLQSLLTRKDKEIEITDNDVLDEIESLQETLQFAESIGSTLSVEVTPKQWGAASNILRWNYGRWS